MLNVNQRKFQLGSIANQLDIIWAQMAAKEIVKLAQINDFICQKQG